MKSPTSSRSLRSLLISAFAFFLLIVSINGQGVTGSTAPVPVDTGDRADGGIRGSARIDPRTLALEFSISLMSYPGRNGHGLSASINYSSKVWKMDQGNRWWYPTFGGNRWVTDLNARFAQGSAGGWTSGLAAPVLHTRTRLYDGEGRPFQRPLGDASAMDSLWGATVSGSDDLTASENVRCVSYTYVLCPDCQLPDGTVGAHIFLCNRWEIGPRSTEPGVPGNPPDEPELALFYVPRLYVSMPGGMRHEFRKDDSKYSCGQADYPCQPDLNGTFLSVDGTGMRLERDDTGSVLYMPNGSKYYFPPSSGTSAEGVPATSFTDVNGNRITYSRTEGSSGQETVITDTLGRNITDFIPQNSYAQSQTAGTSSVKMPWFGGGEQTFQMVWAPLKPEGCEASEDPDCSDGQGNGNGALDDQDQKLFFDSRYFCRGSETDELLAVPSNPSDLSNEVLFPAGETGVRSCNAFKPDAAGDLQPVRFNPVVLSSVTLPNGKSFVFKYNRYGEIARVIYPTGAYEEFDHDVIKPISGTGKPVFDQANRGVVERRIYAPDGSLRQRWKYGADLTYAAGGGSIYKVSSTVSRAADASVDGTRTEVLLKASRGDDGFGFRDPGTGSVIESSKYNEEGSLISRTLFEWGSLGPLSGGEPNARRDLRKKRSITLTFEPGDPNALAVMSEAEYDESGLRDPSYFSQLNNTRSVRWGYAVLEASEARGIGVADASEIARSSPKISDVVRKFKYDPAYREAGISGLVEIERALDPRGSGEVLNETRFEYDSPDQPLIDPGSASGWLDPGSQVRANVTSVRKLDTSTGGWLTERFRYDKFGNTRVTWDASGNEDRNVTVDFSSAYGYAYPTEIGLPPADPEGITGTPERSVTRKTYDLNTGLLTSVTDLQSLATNGDDRTTVTDYADALLRVTSVSGPGGSRLETYYDETGSGLKVTTRELLDEGKWTVSESRYDAFGRVTSTRDVMNEGVSRVDLEYDLHGRQVRNSEPYFEADTGEEKVWHTTEYDASGRVLRRFISGPGSSPENPARYLYGISTVPASTGLWTASVDGSEKSRRQIVDSLGRIVRSDEPLTATGDSEADLGTLDAPRQATYFLYGRRGGLVEVRQGVQRRYYARDAFGRIIYQRLPEQEPSPGITFEDPETGNSIWSGKFEYGPSGELLSAVSPNGVTATSEYDQLGRLVRRSWSDGTPTAAFRYDLAAGGKGEVVEADNGISSTSVRGFDEAGRPTIYVQATAGKNYTSTVEYTRSGEVKRITYPSGKTVDQEYGSDGRLRRVSGESAAGRSVYANAFTFTAAGKTSALRMGNGVWESAAFGSSGRLGSLGLGKSAIDRGVWEAAYRYGEVKADGEIDEFRANGSVARITVSSKDWPDAFIQTFSYDPLGRISSGEELQGGTRNWKQLYSYDRYGNRTRTSQQIANSASSVAFTIEPATNRFSSGTGYRYDRSGNITVDPLGRSFVYDGRNKQTEVRSPDGLLVARYSYDANGRRVKVETPRDTAILVYAGDRLVAEYSTDPSRAGDINFITTDHLGTARVVTGGSGTVLRRFDRLPFGEEIVSGIGHRSAANGYSAATSDLRPGFGGLLNDRESGLGYSEARLYDSVSGRFTAVDPMPDSASPADPRTLNRYSYALNDPVNLVDPLGLAAIDDWYVSDDGKIEVYRTEDPFDRFYVFDRNKKTFVLVAQLERNAKGLVQFPATGYGFESYNPGERGGYDHQAQEYVGDGDHYLKPITAAALFGFTNQLKNDLGITLSLGDMSSENGSDPWDSRFRTSTWDGHHATHGHLGVGSGTNIDFRYVGLNGRSRRGNWATGRGGFHRGKNQAIFDLAKKWGFLRNFRGYGAPISGTRAAKGHNDHGHIGFDLSRKRPLTLRRDRRLYFLRRSDMTLDCLVEQCSWR